MMPLLQRRLRAEWDLLQELAALNPRRLTHLLADDTTFYGTLHGIAASLVAPRQTGITGTPQCVTDHPFRLLYPLHFPAVPMEMYLQTPVQHPNIHPETGFVCLWDKHRAVHTIELALHKLAAMLSGHLYNAAATHVMQPEALPGVAGGTLPPVLLTGVRHAAADALRTPMNGRRRLS